MNDRTDQPYACTAVTGRDDAAWRRRRHARHAVAGASMVHGRHRGRGFPALQQYQQPGRHRARLQGKRAAGPPRAGGTCSARSCETLLRGPLVARFYYIYAVDYDRGGEWSGQAFMCTRDKEFTIRGTEDCLARGYDRTGFFEVDTGEQPSWTVQLTESAEQAPQQPLQSRVPLVQPPPTSGGGKRTPRNSHRREARTDATSAPHQDRRDARPVVLRPHRHRRRCSAPARTSSAST